MKPRISKSFLFAVWLGLTLGAIVSQAFTNHNWGAAARTSFDTLWAFGTLYVLACWVAPIKESKP